jgi:hypothetical protein
MTVTCHIYCPIWVKLRMRGLRTCLMLLSMGEFRENWHKEVFTFYYSRREITLPRAP